MGELIGIAIVIFALSIGIIGYKSVAAESKSKRAKQSGEFDRIHSELQQLKEHVVKIQEYVTDIYIHHYNTERTSKLMNPELYQEPGKESE